MKNKNITLVTDPRLEAALEGIHIFSANLNGILSPIQLSDELMRSIGDLTKKATAMQMALSKVVESYSFLKEIDFSSVTKAFTQESIQKFGFINADTSVPSFATETNYNCITNRIIIEVI